MSDNRARRDGAAARLSDLSGAVALVTGASSGIGYEIAVQLGAVGAAVLVGYNRDAAGAEKAADVINQGGGRAVAAQVDITSVESSREFVRRAVAEFDRLDLACCHTGITSWGKFLDYTEEAFDAVVDTNLKGTYFLAQAAARRMVEQGSGGRIIVTSSVTGVQAVEYLSAYGMTKGGLQMLARKYP